MGHIIIDKGKSFEKLWQESRKKMIDAFGEDILIKDLINMKNEEADQIFNELLSNIGKGIGSLINIFDPEIVVLNGGMKEVGEKLLRLIRAETQKYVLLPRRVEIIWSKLDHPGTLGASLLV